MGKESVFDIVFSAIDYSGDMSRNMNSSDENKYSVNFSPNNIRLLVLSPEGCLVYLHTGVSGKLRIQKRWGAQQYQAYVKDQEMNPKGYQPLVGVLSHYRQCSNIEEVILLSSSKQGAELDYRELEVSNLVKGYHEQEEDLSKRVRDRYKRLAKFTVLNMSFDDFLQIFHQHCTKAEYGSGLHLVSEYIPEQYVNSLTTTLNTEPFSSSSSYRIESTYYMDKSGSLKEHFEKLISTYKDNEKKKKVDEFKKSKSKVDKNEMEQLDFYLKIVACVNKTIKLASYNGVLVSKLSGLPKVTLNKTEAVNEKRDSYGKTKDNNYKLDRYFDYVEDDSLDNSKAIIQGIEQLGSILGNFYLDLLSGLNNPILVKYLVNYEHLKSGYISRGCSSLYQEVCSKYKVELPMSSQTSLKGYCMLCYNIAILIARDCDAEWKTAKPWKELIA